MTGNAREAGRSTIDRVLTLLEALDQPQLTLTEVATKADLPTSTASRILTALEQWGGVSRGTDGTYEVGYRLWEIGARASKASVLREASRPALAQLSARTGESAQLAVLEGGSALIVECLAGQNASPIATRVGGRLPLHASAAGRVLLSYADADFIAKVLRGNLERLTPYTQIMPGRLAQELVAARRRGAAAVQEEMTLGRSSVAAPVRDRSGTVVAALGVVVTSNADLDRLLPQVRLGARDSERRLADADSQKWVDGHSAITSAPPRMSAQLEPVG
ncbi:IclR family transcriptional regulator [Nocardioides immobilis]|uniref:IclR family transcriptional regulator n=1 Tax=Nocardioides immobilis TaxID=2049295 RepID=A0A417Y8X4_9ACTN|nr:IclR family transcriptional regulator [Nocardioides immobilis]RHW29169.1 IclR family transcriptional regulator [Nocardioides immobilis]